MCYVFFKSTYKPTNRAKFHIKYIYIPKNGILTSPTYDFDKLGEQVSKHGERVEEEEAGDRGVELGGNEEVVCTASHAGLDGREAGQRHEERQEHRQELLVALRGKEDK